MIFSSEIFALLCGILSPQAFTSCRKIGNRGGLPLVLPRQRHIPDTALLALSVLPALSSSYSSKIVISALWDWRLPWIKHEYECKILIQLFWRWLANWITLITLPWTYKLYLNEDELEHEHVEISEHEIEQEHEHEHENEYEHEHGHEHEVFTHQHFEIKRIITWTWSHEARLGTALKRLSLPEWRWT